MTTIRTDIYKNTTFIYKSFPFFPRKYQNLRYTFTYY